MIAMLIAAFGAIIAYSGPAHAVATYNASSYAAVTITGFSTISGPVSKPPTLTIIGTAEPSLSESGTTVSGTGTATITEITDVISLTPSAIRMLPPLAVVLLVRAASPIRIRSQTVRFSLEMLVPKISP